MKEGDFTNLIEHKESGYFDGKRYNVGHLYAWAIKLFPVENVPVNDLADQVSDYAGLDNKSLEKVDSSKPLLLSQTDHVIDGKHRLLRAIREGREMITVIRLPKILPQEAEMK